MEVDPPIARTTTVRTLGRPDDRVGFDYLSPRQFDGRGNYALGLKEQVIFPEIVYDKVDKVRGMDVIMVTSARTDEEAKALLAHLGVPFRES